MFSGHLCLLQLVLSSCLSPCLSPCLPPLDRCQESSSAAILFCFLDVTCDSSRCKSLKLPFINITLFAGIFLYTSPIEQSALCADSASTSLLSRPWRNDPTQSLCSPIPAAKQSTYLSLWHSLYRQAGTACLSCIPTVLTWLLSLHCCYFVHFLILYKANSTYRVPFRRHDTD